uniref:Uncharacterized protein n=1 Tax=Rhizophora mucronata TaxID=61149 RepID=A0A2P2QNE4_RHIMU
MNCLKIWFLECGVLLFSTICLFPDGFLCKEEIFMVLAEERRDLYGSG